MIDGVVVKQLKKIPDERGFLMEILRNDDSFFEKFGQAYVTAVYPGVVKGWHFHKKQVDHFCALKGMIKVVLYDGRENSPTHGEVNEFFMGEQNPILVRIPTFVLHGMKGVGTELGLLLNLPTEHYVYADPDEFRVDPHDNDVPYDWARQDR
ncbi:MAG: dTDP-4-dehydrorhamnose 3,5-epimerase family protein [Candidatus Eisenbacteria bacterium]|uniref:dTDP-4-dehydrorhamnose 3,5-epimerase family protein n=1 Tax=Eiseniibacteriota bacterium TaxID=2212470 RepID=A0A956LZ05_UNCEI|nr:dTDP-4-dehydrorhamnose 3,5-epimerase family protein [Candidatus Eisenbacteria bacterium]